MDILRRVFSKEGYFCGIFQLKKYGALFAWEYVAFTENVKIHQDNEDIEILIDDVGIDSVILPFYEDHLWRS